MANATVMGGYGTARVGSDGSGECNRGKEAEAKFLAV